MIAVTVTVPTVAVADENSTLQCASSVPVFRVNTVGEMYLYQHLEPENGVLSWASSQPLISNGWLFGLPVAGPDGNIFAAWIDGALRRYRWNGTGWDTFAGAGHEVIEPSGWERYNTAEYKNRITIDAEGHIYTVEPDGNLHWRSYDTTTRTMRHRVIDDGWGRYNLIVAAGRGVLFARDNAGRLFRYRYHADAQRWVEHQDLAPIGLGWNTYDRVFSAGGDVLYAVQPDGRMFWYRWDENTTTWISTAGRPLGDGWHDWATLALPNTCQRVGTSVPVRPAAPTGRAVSLLGTSDDHIHLSYVDPVGRAVHGEVIDVFGGAPNGIAAIPGLTGATATTTMSEYPDGRVLLSVNGTDTDLREATRGATDIWDTPAPAGGFMATAPSSVRLPDGRVVTFALDADHRLWTRGQLTPNGPFSGWLAVSPGRAYPGAPTPLALERLTLVPTSAGVRIIGLGRDGAFHTANYENQILREWTSLGGSTFTGTASAVTLPDGTLQVFATDNTGMVTTTRQTASGFPGTWTPLTGLTATGNPSAIMAPDGTIAVLAKGSDNYPYYATQSAPGASTFNAWHTITTAEETATDPTALAVPSANTWVVAFLNENDVPRLRRYAPPVPARSAGASFAEIPLG
jgi:hypothetical protein